MPGSPAPPRPYCPGVAGREPGQIGSAGPADVAAVQVRATRVLRTPPGRARAGPGGPDGPVSQAGTLLSPAGARLLERLRGVTVTPGHALSLAAELHAGYPPDLVAAALTQQAPRTAARE